MRLFLQTVLLTLVLSPMDLHAQDRLQGALEVLNQLKAGRTLLRGALTAWKLSDYHELRSHLKWGDTSRTDTILVRKFHPDSGTEEKQRKVLVFLKEEQSQNDLILDLSHEFVHATSRPPFDPYDPGLTPGKYIWAAIEGGGGEVDAVMAECSVALELAALFQAPIQRCQRYLKQEQNRISVLDRNKVRNDFYRVGNWHPQLVAQLGSETKLFPLLSQENPSLYSSTGKAPYPSALLKEFIDITEIACQNSRKRREELEGSRLKAGREEVETFLKKRCKKVGT